MIDWDHAILYDDYGLDKFCEMLDIKLKPYQKKMIWLSTAAKSDAFLSLMHNWLPPRNYGTKYSSFYIDETQHIDGNRQ